VAELSGKLPVGNKINIDCSLLRFGIDRLSDGGVGIVFKLSNNAPQSLTNGEHTGFGQGCWCKWLNLDAP
jgi:hypothetical protein